MKSLLVLLLVAGSLASCGSPSAACPPEGQSVARMWNEAALDAIRRDFPAPTVHARNLFHLSVAMWDAWAAFEPDAQGFVTNPDSVRDGNRDAAVSFAAHTVLSHRYQDAVGSQASLAAFDELLVTLCLNPEEPDSFGVRVGTETIDFAHDDGSLENDQYVGEFEVTNPPLILREPGTTMLEPNRWQQLEFVVAQTQNGQLLESNLQDYVGPHWGWVTPFAMDPSLAPLPLDPGPPPLLDSPTEDDFRDAAVDVIRASAQLGPLDGVTIDISPGSRGGSTLGSNDGIGYVENPVTGEPYEPNMVPAGDYYRVIAEYWADGPDSETPPGHWNALANEVSDQLPALQIAGSGRVRDRLEWDVSLYLVLNGALHDAAIAAWGAKARYDYARPISMIRFLGQTAELPLEDGLVELITTESSAPGERHEELADHVGDVAILSWALTPLFFNENVASVRWIRAVDWKPYQRDTFVTPAFPGYVSGHSTFSRAAAEVLTQMTGTEFFPGGVAGHSAPVGSLEFEDGPSRDVELQWATYYDAADEAGLSRIFGGIHVEADDRAGRVMGATVGQLAWAEAQQYLAD